VLRAEELRRQGRGDEADHALAQALASGRDDSEGLRWQARALRNAERYEEAEAVAARAVVVAASAVAKEGGAEEWIEYGTCLHALAEDDERESMAPSAHRDDALAAFERATEHEPGNVDAWEGGGAVLLRGGHAAESLPWFERAEGLDRRRTEPWEWKAEALMALGRPGEAVEALRRAMRVQWLGRDTAERPQSPLAAVTSLGRPVLAHVWTEKRGVALTAVLYVLGLVVWSLNAGRRDLGIQAAANLQYLLAGLVPAVVLAFALAIFVAWVKIPAWSRDRLLTRSPSVSRIAFRLGSVLWAVGIAAIAVGGWAGLLDTVPVAAPVYAIAAAGFLLLGLTRDDSWLFRLVWNVYVPILIAALAVVAFFFYSETLYPKLPQSLGGGKPRCAQLDLDSGSVSGATLAALAPNASTNQPTVRTAKLDIVFSEGDTLFVKPPQTDRVLELRGGAVRTVAGCG
jgi:tetratricopeptide (TPR) repeat protein